MLESCYYKLRLFFKRIQVPIDRERGFGLHNTYHSFQSEVIHWVKRSQWVRSRRNSFLGDHYCLILKKTTQFLVLVKKVRRTRRRYCIQRNVDCFLEIVKIHIPINWNLFQTVLFPFFTTFQRWNQLGSMSKYHSKTISYLTISSELFDRVVWSEIFKLSFDSFEILSEPNVRFVAFTLSDNIWKKIYENKYLIQRLEDRDT